MTLNKKLILSIKHVLKTELLFETLYFNITKYKSLLTEKLIFENTIYLNNQKYYFFIRIKVLKSLY